jgi:DDE superfamily endonuclease
VSVGKGREHDFRVYKRTRPPLPAATPLLADKGYQGLQHLHTRSTTPHRKPPRGQLTPAQRRANRLLAQQRVVVEQVICCLKVFRILSGRYRHRRKRFGLRLRLLAGLYNFALQTRA